MPGKHSSSIHRWPVLLAWAVVLAASLNGELQAQETDEQAVARLQRVAERRKGVAIICHRGAVEFAHENTLEAYRATFALGADGNEIDIRATKDGVLVCFHDDMLDMILEAYGDVSDYTWNQLQRFRFRRPGPFAAACRIPTLREVFALHRDHAGLMHLDIKQPNLGRNIAALLTEMDLWEHVVALTQQAPAIARDRRYHPLRYKGSLYLDRSEVDPDLISRKLKLPGNSVIVDDPRGVLRALGRPIGLPSKKPVAPAPKVEPIPPDTRTLAQLEAVLEDDADWNQVAQTKQEQAESGKRITARARAADEIARRKIRSPEVLALLERRVRQRSLHKDWRYHGLDGAAALRALIQLEAPNAVALARFVVSRDDAALEAVRNPKYEAPRAWADFRMKMVAFAELERLPGEATEKLCRDYLALSEAGARKRGPLLFEAAARTLLHISPDKETAIELLRHSRSEVRGRTILDCVAKADQTWAREALQAAAPHALRYVVER
jgi:glycerophosphoryl diester phosphodiesterase